MVEPPTVSIGETATTQNDPLRDSETYEIVEPDSLNLLQDRFEFTAFTALETDGTTEIDNF